MIGMVPQQSQRNLTQCYSPEMDATARLTYYRCIYYLLGVVYTYLLVTGDSSAPQENRRIK